MPKPLFNFAARPEVPRQPRKHPIKPLWRNADGTFHYGYPMKLVNGKPRCQVKGHTHA